MVGTAEKSALAATLRHQLGAAVSTDIVKGADFPIPAVGDQDRGFGDFNGTDDEAAWLG